LERLTTRAEQGDAEAQYNLGVRYDTGEGVPQDYAEAQRLAREWKPKTWDELKQSLEAEDR